MNVSFPPVGIGTVIAILVAAAALVLALPGVNQIPVTIAVLIIALAVARIT